MSSNRNDRTLRSKMILEAIAKIRKYLRGVHKADFLGNDEKIDAVCMQLIVIGDNVYELREDLKKSGSKSIPWLEIGNLRHLLAHHYAKMNPDLIWAIAKDDLAPLKKEIEIFIEK